MIKGYRVLYNQDSSHLFYVTKEPITPSHVDRMVDEAADGGADLMLINPNCQRTSYPGRAWQTYWEGYEEGSRSFFGPVPEKTIPARDHAISQKKRLADSGCDYLDRALARCRDKGIGAGVSIRMNDTHDTPWAGSHLLSSFFSENTQWHIEIETGYGGDYSRIYCLDYGQNEVREHYLSLISEIISGYDPDVLELDFMRYPRYFRKGSEYEGRHIMTEFVADVRRLLPSGRYLIVRVPATPKASYDMGLDTGSWAGKKLIDGIVPSAHFVTAWNADIKGYREAAGPDVCIYPSADSAVSWIEGLAPPSAKNDMTDHVMGFDERFLYGFASACYALGADGIYLFNFFCAREWKRRDPKFEIIGNIKNVSDLACRSRSYSIMSPGSAFSVPEADGPVQVPCDMAPGETGCFDMAVARETCSEDVRVEVIFNKGQQNHPVKLKIVLNGHLLQELAGYEAVDPNMCKMSFEAAQDMLCDGNNSIGIKNGPGKIRVCSIEIHTKGCGGK